LTITIDKILEEDHKVLKKQSEKISLGIGRHVHIIWLTAGTPASVKKVELNTELQERVDFDGFNYLDSDSHCNPGSWFARKGFIVRSKKINGEWIQYAFSDEGPVNITRSEVIEYLNVAELEFDEYTIPDFGITKAGG
jgi:hypothetical protein